MCTKRGREPAFPGAAGPWGEGMTKRELMATIIAGGIVGGPGRGLEAEQIGLCSVRLADDLLEELEEETPVERKRVYRCMEHDNNGGNPILVCDRCGHWNKASDGDVTICSKCDLHYNRRVECDDWIATVYPEREED